MLKRMWIDGGRITLPPEVSTAAGFACDAEVFVTIGDGIILLTTQPSLDEEFAEFERLMDEAGISEADLLEGLEKTREEVYREWYGGG